MGYTPLSGLHAHSGPVYPVPPGVAEGVGLALRVVVGVALAVGDAAVTFVPYGLLFGHAVPQAGYAVAPGDWLQQSG